MSRTFLDPLSQATKESHDEVTANTHLHILINIILNTYFLNSYCTNIISQNVNISNVTIPAVFIESNLNGGDLKQILLKTWEMGCTNSVVQAKHPADIVEIFEDIVHRGNQRSGDRKIMFVPNDEDDEDIENVLKEISIGFVPNVLVLSQTHYYNCEAYKLVTHRYNGASENVNEAVLLDVWSSCDGFQFGRNLFPHDMTNLEGKVVKVAAFTYDPYAILDLDKSKLENHDGTEIRIVMEFCRWLNCTIEIVVETEGQWGQIFDNRTGNGVLGAVAMDRADLGITALYSWYSAYKFLDLSMPAIRTGITCLVPSPTLVPGWKLATIPFTTGTWLFVGGVLLFLALIQRLITKSPFLDAAFISFRFMIMQCSKGTMKKTMRVAGIWYVLAGMLLDSFYSSSLSSSLTVPRLGVSIDTVEDLRDSNIEWGATHDAWIFSITNSVEPTIVELVNKFKILTDEELRSKTKSRKFGFSIERLPAGHYAVGDYIQESALPYLQLMQEDIYWEQCLMMARKSSPYTKKYNQLLSRLHSSGLLLAWETQDIIVLTWFTCVVQKHLDMDIQIGVRHSHNQHRYAKVEVFTLTKVFGAFIVLAIGSSAATVALLCEVAIISLNKQYLNHKL